MLYAAYLEVRATGPTLGRGDSRLYERALSQLRRARIAGRRVEALVDPFSVTSRDDPPTLVPDFGHRAGCACSHPEPFGVWRYFSIQLVLETLPGDDDGQAPLSTSAMGAWQLGADAQITVCGKTLSETPASARDLPHAHRPS